MEAILKFNLDELEDRMTHLRCVKSTDMAIVLFDVIHNLYNESMTIDDFYKKFNDLLDEHNIDIDELID